MTVRRPLASAAPYRIERTGDASPSFMKQVRRSTHPCVSWSWMTSWASARAVGEALPVVPRPSRCVFDKEHLVCYNFMGWDAAMTLGLEEDMSTILRRHLTHKVFAKAMPSVWVSRADRAHWPFARPFFIYADKES